MRSLPSFAKINVEHLTYGKLVTTENGPVPFGRDYEVTRMSAGLSRWKFDAMRPSGLARKEEWVAEKVDPAFEARGFLVVKQVANPGNGAEIAVVLARLRFRSEGGEGIVGRRYLQCKSWLVQSQDWDLYASAILAAARSDLLATPDEMAKPGLNASDEEDARKNDRLISLSLSAPRVQEHLTAPVRQILKHVLDQARLKISAQLALGNESFKDEIEFIDGIGQALGWLGESSELIQSFSAGYLGAPEDVCVRWAPSRQVPVAALAPSQAVLDDLRTRLRISTRQARKLSERESQQLADARSNRRDFLKTVVPPQSSHGLERFIRRAKAIADLRNGRQGSIGLDRSSGYLEFLEAYNRSPGEQTARGLLGRFREDFARRLIVERNPHDTYRNALMLACIQPTALDDVNIPLRFIDWALGLAKRVRPDSTYSCLDQLSDNLTSMFEHMVVLCPEEVSELESLKNLVDWFSVTGSGSFAVRKLLTLSKTLDRFIDEHIPPTVEEISEIGAGLKRRCRAAYRRFEDCQTNLLTEPVPGEIVERLYMLSGAYDRIQVAASARSSGSGGSGDLRLQADGAGRFH
jgi:hypothetical protein